MKNKLKKLSPEFKQLLKASSLLADSLGFNIYLVGGVVRDFLLAREVLDLDIVVEGDAIILAKDLAKHLKTNFKKHHAFGTSTVYFAGHKIDFATARTEIYHHDGALPRVTPASLGEDLSRRDFTINAMAISLNKSDYGRLIDLFDGAEDLEKGLIRILHDKSFLDDPTRIFRAIRFEQRFSFKIEVNTFKLMKKYLQFGALKSIASYRIQKEIKLILKEPSPKRYIKRIEGLTGLSFDGGQVELNKRKKK